MVLLGLPHMLRTRWDPQQSPAKEPVTLGTGVDNPSLVPMFCGNEK
jgi:hypothetical protein